MDIGGRDAESGKTAPHGIHERWWAAQVDLRVRGYGYLVEVDEALVDGLGDRASSELLVPVMHPCARQLLHQLRHLPTMCVGCHRLVGVQDRDRSGRFGLHQVVERSDDRSAPDSGRHQEEGFIGLLDDEVAVRQRAAQSVGFKDVVVDEVGHFAGGDTGLGAAGFGLDRHGPGTLVRGSGR